MLKNNLLNKKDLEILKKNYKIEGLCPLFSLIINVNLLVLRFVIHKSSFYFVFRFIKATKQNNKS